MYIYIYVSIRCRVKLGPKIVFLESKLGPRFLMFFIFCFVLFFLQGDEMFEDKTYHLFDSTFLTFLGHCLFQNMPEPKFLSVFGNKCIFSPPPKKGTPSVNTTALTGNICPFFRFFWGRGVLLCPLFVGSFLRGMKKPPKKTLNSKQNNKKGNKTTRCKHENHLVLFQQKTTQTQYTTTSLLTLQTKNTRKTRSKNQIIKHTKATC